MHEDSTSLSSGFDFDGQSHEVGNIPFDIETDLLNFDVKYRDLEEFWGEHDEEDVEPPTGNTSAERNRWYRSYIILAIPHNQKFMLLCKNSFEESLEFVYEEFKSEYAPDFLDHLCTFLSVAEPSYSRSKSAYSQESIIKVVEMLTKAADVELVKSFITRVLKKNIAAYSYRNEVEALGLEYSGTENIFSDLFKCVPWEGIKSLVEDVISQCKTDQYQRWLNVASSSGISDISQKVAESMYNRISQKKWSPKTDNDNVLLVLLYKHFYNDSSLFSHWWPKFSSLTEITGNIDVVSNLLSRLPFDHPSGYAFLFDCFIHCLQSKVNTSDIEKYSSLVFSVVRPVIDNVPFKPKLEQLCNTLVTVGNIPIIGRLLAHLADFKQSLLETQCFQIFLAAFMQWFSVAKLNDTHTIEVLNVAQILVKADASSEQMLQNFIDTCQKVQDTTLLCRLIVELNCILNENRINNATEILKSLLNALLSIEKHSSFDVSCLSSVILIMFQEDIYHDLLKNFLIKNIIVTSVDILGAILSHLCAKENEGDFPNLKGNVNFLSVLLNYIRLFQQQKIVPDHKVYSIIITFLFADENWCNEHSTDLIPVLIGADCVKKDFRCYANVIAIMLRYKSQNYRTLLSHSVNALDLFLDRKQLESGDYELVQAFVKTLIEEVALFHDIYKQFSALRHLKSNDELNMYGNSSSVLMKLIEGLKEQFQGNDAYNELLTLRIKNLQEVVSKGKPGICWRQPDAIIPGHPDVERFLRSDEQTYMYQNFNGIGHARNWASKHFSGAHGYGRSSAYQLQKKKGYCCTVETGGIGKKAYAMMKKTEEFHKEKLVKYANLESELRQRLSVLKRPLKANLNVVPRKKPLVESNIIVLDD